jgi:alpha-mannosidase
LGARDNTVEATVWAAGQAIGGIDWAHLFCRLAERAEPGQTWELELRTFARNAQTTVHGAEKPREPKPEEFQGLFLVSVDREVADTAYDVAFALNLYESFEERDPAREIVLRALNDVCNVCRPERRKTLAVARRVLKEALDGLNGEAPHTLTAVGHAHLDTAWLWPLAVTRLKMLHTTALQLGLMERYPEHVFAHSQASQYEWLEQDAPDLFDRVRRAARKGQWEPLGSMWVEADCNLTGGEALVRQFLYGRRYFREKFGTDTIDMFLPDVFGYSAALPQILSQFGIRAFLTQKLSWNQFNKLPHHTFWWQGIDGSKVWTHFPPADTYIASCEPKEIAESVRKFKDHGRSDRSLYLYGYGDGGGGPTERHIEFLRRARQAPGLPMIESKRKAADFYRDAIAESRDLCTWVGELYFELHRGTYTSQAANKKANRECEFLLRDAEWLASFAPDYPAAELEAAWKLVLLNQFHDIIPGSSVKEVYEDSAKDYAEVRETGARVIDAALRSLARRLDTAGMARPVALFQNTVLPTQAEIAWSGPETPGSLVAGDERAPVQVVEQFGERSLVFATPVAALGAVAVADLRDEPCPPTRRLKVSTKRLESDELAVRFDSNGHIVSIQTLDDEPVEFVAPGKLANGFQIFDDHPLFWDAWDVDVFTLETGRDLLRADSVEVAERGPVRAAIEVVRSFGRSQIRQRISLGPTPGIRFDTWVDWHEDEKMLKVAFPLNVNAQRATFEIQFGHVERPTHRNTSWDLARFEVCAQKWVDVSEGGHGVALLNDGKYGHDVLDDTLRLTLLRSPKAPDPTCDMGQHRFTYVLMPHYDQLAHSDVVAAAYGLNAPMRSAQLEPKAGIHAEMPRLVASDNRSLVVETVKRAEDSDLLVVRAYECHNTRGRATVSAALPVKRAWRADLNEAKTAALEVVDGTVVVDFKPFEIVTLLIEV